ncbi:MAG: FAD-binding oxidoreductase [Halodesulfurarchaeum sp.]
MSQSQPSGDELASSLASIVGNDDVTTRRDELVGYSRDAFPEDGVLPDAVVRVEDTSEVQAVLQYANERGLHVVPRAMGTSLTGSVVPVEGGIVMDMRPMDQILELNEDDMFARVQPGVRWETLNERAEEYGLHFPVDPGSSSVVTVCGMIATHASGMRAVKYGTTGDHTMDLEVVLADGTTFETGTRSIKNSAGYDLTSLLVGSEGTLGVITEATVRLTPLPERSRTFMALFDDLETAGELFVDVKQSNFDVSAMELLDRPLLETLQEGGFDVPTAEVMVLVELVGDRAFEESYDELTTLAAEGGAAVRESDDPEELWTARRSAYPSLVRRCTHPITGDIGVPISTLPEMLRTIREIRDEMDLPVSVLGHAGDGNLHPVILASEDTLERGKDAHDRMCEAAVDLGGTVTTEHGVGIEKNHLMEYQYGEEGVAVMRRLKRALDPNNVLNPGKITPSEENAHE